MEALEEQYPDKRRLFVFTSLADKDTETVIQLLIRKGDKVFACEAPTPRTRKPEEIGAMIKAQKIDAAFMAEPSVKLLWKMPRKKQGQGILSLSADPFTFWEMPSVSLKKKKWKQPKKRNNRLKKNPWGRPGVF